MTDLALQTPERMFIWRSVMIYHARRLEEVSLLRFVKVYHAQQHSGSRKVKLPRKRSVELAISNGDCTLSLADSFLNLLFEDL